MPERRSSEPFFDGIDTLPAMLARRARSTPGGTAYFEQRGDDAWHAISWEQFARDVDVVAARLRALGMGPGTRAGILAPTSVEWEIAQMAAFACGAIVAGIDPYYPDTLLEELVGELGVVFLFVDDTKLLARLGDDARRSLRHVVLLRETPSLITDAHLHALAGWRAAVPTASAPATAVEPDAPALIAFSSGSSARPKPVLYTHAQVVHACRTILELYPELSPGTRLVCWLPLANLFQRMIDFAAIANGATSYVVSDPRRVMDVLPLAKPEVFVAVPRFCERVHDGIVRRLSARPGVARLLEAAIRLGAQVRGDGQQRVRHRALKRLALRVADRTVLARLRAVFGGRLRFIVTGSAPMPEWLLRRFFAIGIPVLEAYGASENLVPIAANRLGARRIGTVGKPAGDNVVRIGDDGEVQVRGAGVFIPTLGENAARAAALTDDGYLATGDIGALDEDGYLVLRGRRNEAFKNAQGRWISLPVIEAALRRIPGVDHAAVVRLHDDRLVGVLALPGPPAGTEADDPASVERREGESWRARIDAALRGLPPAMRPFAFIVVCAGFSPASHELTTNLKLRRSAIAKRVAEPLAAIAALPAAQMDEPPLRFV